MKILKSNDVRYLIYNKNSIICGKNMTDIEFITDHLENGAENEKIIVIIQDTTADIYKYIMEYKNDTGYKMNLLGFMYENGYGVERNNNTSMEYYEMAVEMGNVHAMHNLGYKYRYGEGVEWDYNKSSTQ